MEKFGIPAANIFNSRSTTFAAELMRATESSGVDVILNSLTGDLLNESWRCIANGGVMVELGKKDMLDRNYLSIKPFGRNIFFRYFNISYKYICDTLITKYVNFTNNILKKYFY